MNVVLKALKALEYQINLENDWRTLTTSTATLTMYSSGNVFIKIPEFMTKKYGTVQICDGPPNDELLRVAHSIRLWFEENDFDFDEALKKVTDL